MVLRTEASWEFQLPRGFALSGTEPKRGAIVALPDHGLAGGLCLVIMAGLCPRSDSVSGLCPGALCRVVVYLHAVWLWPCLYGCGYLCVSHTCGCRYVWM